MDDLEHSVFIAEQDWNCFCEESEECSIQQAGLAGLEDSGLSDTDDDKRFSQEPVLSLQTNPVKLNEKQGAAAQTLDNVEECNVRDLSEDSERFSCETDRGCCPEQAAQIGLNDNTSTDYSISGSGSAPSDQQHMTPDTESVEVHDQCQGEGKSGQATEAPVAVTSSPGIQDTGSVGSSDVPMVTESLATPKKEKERWFVTVNDSPVHIRISHGTPGQKKRRKKKRSRDLAEQSVMTKRPCTLSNTEKEAREEMIAELPGHGSEEDISRSANSQRVDVSPVKETEAKDCERSSVTGINCTLAVYPSAANIGNLNCSDVLLDKPENNHIYVNSPTPLIITRSLQLQNDVLNGSKIQKAYDQNTTSQCERNTDVNTHEPPVTNMLCHVHDDAGEIGSRFTLISSKSAPLDKLHQYEEYLKPIHKEKDPCLSENWESANESLEAAVSPSHPIYALSSFWNEMEKLTINDILHLRVANDKSPLKEVNPEKSDAQDKCLENCKDRSSQDSNLTDDPVDSDYFTHLDDSKPDRSSCEFSAFSDFDDEFIQIFNASANPSPEPQNVNESSNTQESLPEQELELSITNNKRETEDIIMLSPQDGMHLYLSPDAKVQSSFLASDQDSIGSPFEWEATRNTPSSVLSMADTLYDKYLLTLSEISTQNIEGLETRSLEERRSVVSFPFSQKLSVPETYDDFFSDFEVANFFFPSVQDKTIPIFSSPHSVVGDLVLPEVEELSMSDTENENFEIQVMTPERLPSHSPNFYFFTNQKRNWRSLLSLRRIRCIGRNTWSQRIGSWIFSQEAKVPKVQSASLLPPLEGKALVQFVEQQEHQHAVSISTREGFLFSIGQADICLVCIAFASWVLKSSNPQSADMWKAALLANVSAISAIQYLRKYVKTETTNYDP